MEQIPLSKRRGFEFSELMRNKLGILLVKASIEKVSPTVVELLNGILETDVFGREHNFGWGCILSQYREHDWTIVFPFDICAGSTVLQISKMLETYCIYLQHEDTSSCSSYELLHCGNRIEEFQWGCDYIEEVWGIAAEKFFQFAREREASGNPLPFGWNPNSWDIYCIRGYSSYQFRSSINKATEAEVIDTNKFLDTLLRHQNAWLPDWECLPYGGEHSQVNAEDFVRVDLISNAKSVNEVHLKFFSEEIN